jgi:plastocyanin
VSGARTAFLLLACWGGALRGGSITGSLELARPADAERVVVYVENVPEGSFPQTGSVARLSQKRARFNPGVLPIVRGSQVDLSNDDWVSHNVFAKSAAKTFDLGLYPREASKVVTFGKLGVVPVFCSIHPNMNAVILVLQNPFFTKPSADGRFRIDGVPAGRVALKVFRSGRTGAGKLVTVPATGAVSVEL